MRIVYSALGALVFSASAIACGSAPSGDVQSSDDDLVATRGDLAADLAKAEGPTGSPFAKSAAKPLATSLRTELDALVESCVQNHESLDPRGIVHDHLQTGCASFHAPIDEASGIVRMTVALSSEEVTVVAWHGILDQDRNVDFDLSVYDTQTGSRLAIYIGLVEQTAPGYLPDEEMPVLLLDLTNKTAKTVTDPYSPTTQMDRDMLDASPFTTADELAPSTSTLASLKKLLDGCKLQGNACSLPAPSTDFGLYLMGCASSCEYTPLRPWASLSLGSTESYIVVAWTHPSSTDVAIYEDDATERRVAVWVGLPEGDVYHALASGAGVKVP